MELLTSRVDDLEKENVTLHAELDALRKDLSKYHAEFTRIAQGAPQGYTSMYITRANFDNVEGTALMKFFVRP
jgi:hypothetical protein